MKLGRNQWFAYISDADMQTEESYETMILRCTECGALFQMKACGMRTMFPWWGYHPTDGNVQVLTATMKNALEVKARDCGCGCDTKRLKTAKELDDAITFLVQGWGG